MRNKKQAFWTKAAIFFALFFTIAPAANAMHIMEGYLPIGYCIAWGAICIPFIVSGVFSLKKIMSEHRKTILLLAMAGAYAFVLSALKIPSVSGSSSHPTGTGLSAILFGPGVTAIIGLIVLLFQATLLAHGGLTTLGANTFSMAIAGPIVSYAIYRIGIKCKGNKKAVIFFAAAIGNLFTYFVTSVQLGLAHPVTEGGVIAAIGRFMGIFVVTQVPLAIIEGLLTVVVIIGLEAYASNELKELNYIKGDK